MKTVVVTGGTLRLGRAISERLRQDGWRVITTSHRPDAGADIVADLADPMGPARLYAAALKLNEGLPPDALVNNAALFTGEAATLEQVNFIAPRKLTMMMAGRETGRGSVVNILDARILTQPPTTNYQLPTTNHQLPTTNHQLPTPNPQQPTTNYQPPTTNYQHPTPNPQHPYTKSKRDLLDDTLKSAALFIDTLRVNAVAPGPVLPPTEVHEKAAPTPLGRPTPQAVADAVAFLLAAEHTTGCVIPVDGGATLS